MDKITNRIGGDLKLYVIAREICSWRYSNGRRY